MKPLHDAATMVSKAVWKARSISSGVPFYGKAIVHRKCAATDGPEKSDTHRQFSLRTPAEGETI